MFTGDMTEDRGSWGNSEGYRRIQPVQVQPNETKMIRQFFTVQIYNDPKYSVKAAKGLENVGEKKNK